jgi:hypothetical protein
MKEGFKCREEFRRCEKWRVRFCNKTMETEAVFFSKCPG